MSRSRSRSRSRSTCRNVCEARVVLHFYVVSEAGEDESGDTENHAEQSELGAGLDEGVDDGLEAAGVPGGGGGVAGDDSRRHDQA